MACGGIPPHAIIINYQNVSGTIAQIRCNVDAGLMMIDAKQIAFLRTLCGARYRKLSVKASEQLGVGYVSRWNAPTEVVHQLG